MITHLVIIKLSRRARRPLDLCYGENMIQGENQRRDLEILVVSTVPLGLGMFLLYVHNDDVSATISVTE